MRDLVLRGVLAVAVAGLGAGSLLLQPAVTGSGSPAPEPAPPVYQVCPLAEAGGGFSSRLGMAGDLDEPPPALVTVVRSGAAPRSVELPDGTVALSVEELAELGITPILVEGTVTAATFTRAGDAVALAGCATAPSDPVVVLGLATSGGQDSTMVLVNPFALEARARLEAVSEFGGDTPADLEEVRIPPFTTIELTLGQVMAGRDSLSFAVTPTEGMVVAAMRKSGRDDLANSEAIPLRTQWFVPLPDFGSPGELHLRSAAAVETAYRVDAFGPQGLVEGATEGVLAASGQVVLSVDQIAEAGGGLVVSSAEPIGAALVHAAGGAYAVAAAADRESARWLVPVTAVSAEGRTALWILNTADGIVGAEVRQVGSGLSRHLELPPGTTTGAIVAAGATSLSVDADGPVVVFYGVLTGSAVAMTAGVPLE